MVSKFKHLTTKQLEIIDNRCSLHGYPKSHYFHVGMDLYNANHHDLAIASFKRGAENDGCVACMVFYVWEQIKRNNIHLALPWAIEASIRGHVPSMDNLIDRCYNETKPMPVAALSSHWVKMKIEIVGDTADIEVSGYDDTNKDLISDDGCYVNSEESRKYHKKQMSNLCRGCGKEDSKDNDVTLTKCGICKYYSYCGKDCQIYHWKDGNHRSECRQVIILRKYCKLSYVKEIGEAIIGGQDPKEIHTLRRLRTKLGLNRPKEEYEELLLRLDDDNDNSRNTNNYNIILKRGTKVKVQGLVKASHHNGKSGIVKKVLISGEGERHRVGVKLSDDSGTVLNIKIENLESVASATNTTNRPNPYEYITARKDGTVHIGSTPNVI